MPKRVKVGDILLIPLPDGRFGYGQYIHWNPEQGPLVQVFAKTTAVPSALEEIEKQSPLFPPVFVGLMFAVNSGRWKILGNLTIEDFKHPLFKHGFPDKSGVIRDWQIWDGSKYERLGADLPERYHNLELLLGWSPQLIEERVVNGLPPDHWINRVDG